MKNSLVKSSLILSVFFMVLILSSCTSGEAEQNKDMVQNINTDNPQLWTCGMHPEVILNEPGQCPKCGMNLVPVKQSGRQLTTMDAKKEKGKILYWQAPMDPTEIYDKPGKSKMGMDLIPVYEGDVSSGSTVTIDPVTVQNMGVRTMPVERTDFSRVIRTVGIVEYNEEKMYTVSTKISGWIDKLYVDFTGKAVRKNQPLLDIYSPDLVTTQQEYLLALKNKELIGETKYASIKEGAESLLNSTRLRLLYWDIPQSEISRLEQRGTVKKTLTLESPVNGVVTHKNAVEGLFVKEGTALYQIADLSKVWINVSIYDNEAPWLRLGQDAQMELSYLPGQKFNGKVTYIYPYLSDKARDLKVRLEFANPDLQLKPGMYSNVTIKTETIPDAIVVPTEAVLRSGQRNIVFVSRGEGRFEPREVTIGQESEDRKIRIISGLLGNENIVVSAQFLLDSESRLQEAIQKMLAEKSMAKMDKKDKPKEQSMPQDHSGMKQEKNKSQGKNIDHSKMQMDDNQNMDMNKAAEMKSDGDMEMDKKTENHNVEKKNTQDTEMKCGAGMDMGEGKNAGKKSGKKDDEMNDE